MNSIVAREIAEARCRRDGGPLSEVRWRYGDRQCAEVRSPYGALALAKSLVHYPAASDVSLVLADGQVLDAAAILAARY